MLVNFKELGEFGIRRILQRGADFADIFFERRSSFSVKCEENRVESVTSGVELGAGIRVIKNGKTFYGFTNRLSKDAIAGIADLLTSGNVSANTPVDFRELPEKYPNFIEGEAELSTPVERKIDIVRAANEKAREFGDRVKQVTVVLRDSLQEILIVNSLGEIIKDIRPRVVFYVLVVASDGTVLQTGYEPVGHLGDYSLFDAVSPEEVASKAADRALKMLKARPAPSGTFTVVISSQAGGTMIHEAVGHGLEADLANQGLSVYSGKLGEKVANDVVTVIDDGTLRGKYGTTAYDDEGVPTQRTVLIEDGYLKSFMYDRYWAMKTGNLSTGNGRRQSYMHIPIPRMRNTFIAPGNSEPESILEDTESGIFVVKMGGGQVNTVNGDFIFEVNEGYLIENGRVKEPIRGASLIGNGPKILREIDAVGNDLGFTIGTCGKDGQGVPVSDALPTIRIRSITVGGTD